MDNKNRVINDILVAMGRHIDDLTMSILQSVLNKVFSGIEIVACETLPSTEFDDNLFLFELFNTKKAPKLKPETAEHYRKAAQNLVAYTGKSLIRIMDIDVNAYLDEYESKNGNDPMKKNSKCTRNNERRFLSAFFTWLRKEHFIVFNPVENVDALKEDESEVIVIDEKEMEELRTQCKDTRERALIEVLRSSGARIGEIEPINLSWINWWNGSVRIQSEKHGPIRTIILDQCALYYVKKYVEDRKERGITSDALFVSCRSDGNRIGACRLREIFNEICIRTGNTRLIEKVTPHKFRSTFITNLNKKGCPFPTIQKLVGHKYGSSVTYRKYMSFTENQLMQAHEMYAS